MATFSKSMNTALIAAAGLSVGALQSAYADADQVQGLEEIVVTASRTPQSLADVGSAIDVLTADDIAERPRVEVSDLLREVPGIAVNRGGGLGSLTQVRIRGAEADQTVVLLNGIEVGDPFNNAQFDFGNLLTEDVDRIEVLRGPQSALYGAQAIGGVINIITTQGNGPTRYKFEGEGGSFGTYLVSGAANGGGSDYHYAGSAAFLATDGVPDAIGGVMKDGHTNLTLNAHGDTAVSDIFNVSLAVRYVDGYAQQDTQDFNFGSPTYGLVVDANDAQKTQGFYAKASGTLSLFDGHWDHIFSAAVTDVTDTYYENNAFSSGSFGRKVVASYQTDATVADTAHNIEHTLTGYAELQYEDFIDRSAAPGPQNQERSTLDSGYVGEYRIDIAKQLHLSAAVRFDANDDFQNATTYRFSAAWEIPDTGLKLRSSYGSGFAKPTFFDLFGYDPTTFVGNPNLKPETSHGWDVGADYGFGGTGLVSVSYFQSDLTNEITTDFSVFPFTALNEPGRATRNGVEFSARYSFGGLTLAGSYSYMRSLDSSGADEVRRPRNIGSASAFYRFADNRASVGVSADYNGKMTDVVFVPSIPSGVAPLKAFTLVTANASYTLTSYLELFARVENLLDTRYQEVYSYNSMGRAVYGGVKLRFGG